MLHVVKPLTWYKGSVLPYASLWSTLLRATWLNDLRKGDIYKLAQVEEKILMISKQGVGAVRRLLRS